MQSMPLSGIQRVDLGFELLHHHPALQLERLGEHAVFKREVVAQEQVLLRNLVSPELLLQMRLGGYEIPKKYLFLGDDFPRTSSSDETRFRFRPYRRFRRWP